MDDLDRILWRSKLHGDNRWGYYNEPNAAGEAPQLLPRNPGIHCRDYWAEPLGKRNADLRNQGFEAECRLQLGERAASQYRRMRDWLQNDDDNELVFRTPNQYVKILKWLDFTGDELLNTEMPPYRILEAQSQHPYAHWREWMPTDDGLIGYARQYDERLSLRLAGNRQGGRSEQRRDEHRGLPLLLPATLLRLLGAARSGPDTEPEPKRRNGAATVRRSGDAGVSTQDRLSREGPGRVPAGQDGGTVPLVPKQQRNRRGRLLLVVHPAGDYCERKP